MELIGVMAAAIWSPVIHVSIALGTALWIAATRAGACTAVLALGLRANRKQSHRANSLAYF